MSTNSKDAATAAERARCAEIALRWMREADAKLGAGWRTDREIAIAEIIAKGIADEIMGNGDE